MYDSYPASSSHLPNNLFIKYDKVPFHLLSTGSYSGWYKTYNPLFRYKRPTGLSEQTWYTISNKHIGQYGSVTTVI